MYCWSQQKLAALPLLYLNRQEQEQLLGLRKWSELQGFRRGCLAGPVASRAGRQPTHQGSCWESKYLDLTLSSSPGSCQCLDCLNLTGSQETRDAVETVHICQLPDGTKDGDRWEVDLGEANGKYPAHLKLGPSPIYCSRGLHVLIIMLFLIYCFYREIKPSQVAQW